ncbi:MAG TPA: hypothetical protein VGX68_29805 [Thermoanaerobaculia bacterium]|jgi:hypothetical protein|nr:hypothetical protein [Thermoanaerobaculia bacterium]
MKTLLLTLAILSLAVAASPPAGATACFNSELIKPCATFWKSAAVFAGKALAVQKVSGSFELKTRFEVLEAFVGVSGPEVEVQSGSAEQAFGYEFEVGESYMIYASRTESGALATSICRGSGPLARAAEDLAYARAAVKEAPRTSVIGRVAREERPAIDLAMTITPLAGIPVAVEASDGRRFSAVTDTAGEFAVTGPDAGSWTVRAEMPAGQPPAAPVEVQVPSGRCAYAELASTTMGTVRGRLLDERGRPAPNRWVYLAPASELPAGHFPVSSEAVETDGQGRWMIPQVPAGEYVLLAAKAQDETDPLVPLVFFPGTREREKAGRVQVKASTPRELPDFRLPPRLTPRRIAGVVRWPDGRPVDGVRVSLGERGLETNIMTDTDGSFELSSFAERSYELLAACKREDGGVLETKRRKVSAGGGEVRVELVLDRPAPYGEGYWIEQCPEGAP